MPCASARALALPPNSRNPARVHRSQRVRSHPEQRRLRAPFSVARKAGEGVPRWAAIRRSPLCASISSKLHLSLASRGLERELLEQRVALLPDQSLRRFCYPSFLAFASCCLCKRHQDVNCGCVDVPQRAAAQAQQAISGSTSYASACRHPAGRPAAFRSWCAHCRRRRSRRIARRCRPDDCPARRWA